jgi:serine/threonine-protein kinase
LVSAAEHYRRVREVFHEAVELDADSRERFLAPLSADAPDVLAEVRSLLEAHEASGDFMAEGLRTHEDPLLGRRLGPFRLLRLLGRGGMGAVYHAERVDETFRQEVAIKLLPRDLATPELVRRLRGERQTLASLGHPNIARLVDGGTTEDGLPYLVMEYVEGVPLEEHCDARGLGLDARLALFMDVASAVADAHRNLVVHCDIKPANILVTEEGTPKLLDFGIAKLLAARAKDETAPLTRAHGYATPAFASPEQLTSGAVTTATDVYALGILLYRLLAGVHPYDLTGKSEPEVTRIVCEAAPRAPSSSAGRFARSLAGDLDQIVLKALRKEPERRYGSVSELSEDLRRRAAGLPVSARPDTLRYRAGKFVGRHRSAVAVTALVVLGLAGGLAAYARQARIARAEARRAEVEKLKQEQVSAFLKTTLASADPVRGEGRKVTVAEILDRASTRITSDLRGQREVEASLRETLGETYLNLGLSREAERELRRALELAGSGGAPDRAGLAQALLDQGRYAEAETELKKAIALFRASGERSIRCAHALSLLMAARQNQGRFAEAAVAGREALVMLKSAFPSEKLELASVLNNLGVVLGNDGRFAEAEGFHRQAVEAARAARGERHPTTAEALVNLAGILDIQGRYAEAEPIFKEALPLQESLLGERHFDFIRTLTSYSNMLWLMKRSAEAEPLARRANALALSSLGAGHPVTAYSENILGGILLDTRKPKEAEGHIRTALEARRKALPPGHWLIASAQSNLGAALAEEGRSAAAEKELLEAYAALEKDRGPKHEKSRLTAERLADLYAKSGRATESRRWRERAEP